jgi:hypothetical protein
VSRQVIFMEGLQMPSPFPGMDPYLEQFWGDIHARLVLYACDQLQGLLPRNLRARVQERVFVDAPQTGERDVYPDVRVVERGRGPAVATAPPSAVAVAQPLIVQLADEPVTETFIEIIDIGSGRRVVTVIEVLSPANKRPGPGKDLYLKKQGELLGGQVSLVEIDLLRGGQWVLSVEPRRIPPAYRTPYRVVVRRGWQPQQAEYYAVPLRQRLPAIRVPLRQADADVALDWQSVLDRCYDNGGYQDDLDYEAEPDPPLSPEDAAWADDLLREQGRRHRPAPPQPRRRTKKKGP